MFLINGLLRIIVQHILPIDNPYRPNPHDPDGSQIMARSAHCASDSCVPHGQSGFQFWDSRHVGCPSSYADLWVPENLLAYRKGLHAQGKYNHTIVMVLTKNLVFAS